MSVDPDIFYRLGVSLFIGILIGLQREHISEEHANREGRYEMFAGVRTFALISLTGCIAALLADLGQSPWIFIGVAAPLALLIAVGYYVTSTRADVGMTTEVAAVATILVGALCYWGDLVLAVALGVTITVLLSLKLEMQQFVARLTRTDILAALKFAVITAIVLPLLPDETFGVPPFDIFNPYHIWLFVVLISGISFLGYILMKFFASEHGITLTGLLGGLASSTATTLSFAQRSRGNAAFARAFALAVLLAWTVMFGRALVEVGLVNFALFRVIWLPMVITAASGLAYCAYLFASAARDEDEEEVSLTNPFELAPALTFGLIYVVVLVIARAGQYYFGDTGLYVSSALAGLAGIDAVALSVSELANQPGGPELATAGRAVVLAALANTLAKGGLVIFAGSRSLARVIAPGFFLMLAVGIGAILLIPG
ncbi:MAG TPA: MgtC/SapB family protein [Candidatus Sulfomarinibacteraceae bacterium]|nr:MgtC/SapB family protein [Candidatus Sulfomarinibacteraceae bacterium]